MKEEESSSRYAKMQNDYELKYEQQEAEGECIILSITPVRFVQWRFIMFIFINVFLLVPLLLTYWNEKYKRVFYMKFCPLNIATHFYIVNYDQKVTIVRKQEKHLLLTPPTKKKTICFKNRYMTYTVDEHQKVRLLIYDYKDKLKALANAKEVQKGMDEATAHHLKYTFGPGTMVIQKPTVTQLLIAEITKPLCLFLIFGVLFWLFGEAYYYFSSALLVIFIAGLIINLYQMVQLNNKRYEMAYYETPLHVLREGQVKQISSFEAVPGDVVFLRDPIKIPFEGIILQGSALINECALTGESVPIVKKADRLDKVNANPAKVDKNAFLFEGTTIVQVSDKKKMSKYEKYREQFGIPVCVIKTNFLTTKGQLIRIILFPREQENSFQRQAAKFLFFMFGFSVVTYIALVAINYEYEDTVDIIMKFIDLILIAVPPGLPVSMTFGIIYAVEKLSKKGIFCIEQNKVITGGMIQFACFDKTGTLTEDYMDFYCAVPAWQGKFHTQIVNTPEMSTYIIQNNHKKPYYLPILNNMAANHSIIQVETTNELIGDPMEIKTFNFGQFRLNQSPEDPEVIFCFESDRGHTGTIYRRFEFQSQLQRMSVIAKTSTSQGYCVYAKGSPEMMLNIMKVSSVPKNYNQMLKEYASHGFRVLSVASKPVTEQQMKNQGREDIENGLVFNGFQVFENKLKPQTKAAIEELKAAEIGCVMITGDNTLTGSNISFKCSITPKDKGLLIIDLVGQKLTEEEFIFHDYDNFKDFPTDKPIAESYIAEDIKNSNISQIRLSKRSYLKQRASVDSFEPMKDTNEQFMFNTAIKAEETNCKLCLTGRAFNHLFPGSVSQITLIHRRFMEQATVFARTKPNDKAKIVMVYQQMGKKTSMCGDGANDCGALKQADIGLSLSQAQASISAPFTSQVTNISSMVELIKECRAGLATNFSLFNIMAIYSLIQYTTTFIEEVFLSYAADFQFLYWDLVLNFSLIVFVGYTGTAERLSVQRPRGTLFSLTNLFQLFFMFLVQAVGQILSIMIFRWVQPDYYRQFGGFDNNKIVYDDEGDLRLDSVQDNAIFIFVNNIYLVSVLAFNISHPWRKQFYTNPPLVIAAVLALTYNIVAALVQQADWSVFELKHLVSFEVRQYLIITSLVFAVAIYVIQKYILEPITYKLIKKYPNQKWL